MEQMQQLKDIYEEYAVQLAKARKKANFFAGIFGMGDDPKKHYCNDLFFENSGKWVEKFLESDPSPSDTAQAVWWILRAASLHAGEETYWYYYAAQVHAKKLIPLLDDGDRREMAVWYDGAYPPRDRLPAQKEIFKMLQNT